MSKEPLTTLKEEWAEEGGVEGEERDEDRDGDAEEDEAEGVRWAREVMQHSPTAIRCLKAAFNAETDGLAGLQELAGNATLLYYLSEEGAEGKNAFLEKRQPDFGKYPWLP